MTSIDSNIEELKKILNEPNFKLDKAIEFLEAIDGNASALKEELGDQKIELSESKLEIAELESPDNFESSCDSTIHCGLGDINYEQPSNILLQDLMENLDLAIQKNGSKKVSEILASIS